MAADKRTDWATLTHPQKVQVLASTSIEQIVRDYRNGDQPETAFKDVLARERRLWDPDNIREFKHAGQPPTKDVVLGAWRDLDRAEALLELIDNSIDEWLRRKKAHPAKSAPELNIHVQVDEKLGQLTYLDNAGGVSTEKLNNLVVPGYSDTLPESPTIGSYKTGGKKAVFRLATAAQITTRYWNPAETSDDAVSVQLDEGWINDPTEYRFAYAVLKDKSVLEKGQTRYVFQLREEPVGGPSWYASPEQVERITRQVRQTYTLLLIRNPKVLIYFFDNTNALKPQQDLYDFSGAHNKHLDIRPQQVVFEVDLEHGHQRGRVEVEVVLGCRTSAGAKKGRPWGIDLYGNDRLFVASDQGTFADMLPQGNNRNLVRGLVNIRGPNAFIPWDTHKRHLNPDTEIMTVLTKHPLIRAVFENWKAAYNAISGGEVTRLIETPVAKVIDTARHDLAIEHRSEIQIDSKKKRGVQLPPTIFKPRVPTKKKRRDLVNVKLSLTFSEARSLLAQYAIDGEPDDPTSIAELAACIKAQVLKKAKR